MNRVLKVLAVVLLVGLWGCTPAEEPTTKFEQYTFEQFLESTTVFGGSFNHDETKLLVTSNETGVYNVFSIDIATGEKTQLTDSESTTYGEAYLPNSDDFFFSRDNDGDEVYNVFLQKADGEVVRITKNEESREVFYGFSHDLKSFYTANNSRDKMFMDLYKWDLETMEPEMVYQNNEGLNVAAISNNGRYLALRKTIDDFDSDMYLVDLQGDKEPVMINDPEGEVNYNPSDFAPDGSKLFYTTDKDSNFTYLMSYDLATGETEEVFRADWNVLGVSHSYNGTYRIIYVNENAVTKYLISNMETGEELEITDMPAGNLSGFSFSRSEKMARFHILKNNAPSDLYVYNVEEDDISKLTDNINPAINPDNLVNAEYTEVTARDGLVFNGWLYKPKMAAADEKVPALLWIHGGPGGQSRPTYRAEIQFLVNHGYAIFDLNYRGSSGYGREFSMADDQKHGREPLWDCVDAKNYLIDNVNWVDAEKIGIIGGSYGGYMVMAALAFTPEEFAVGVDIFGVTNWVRTLKSIPAWWESFRKSLYREIGDPETMEEELTAVSPLFHADKITKPVLILQGANDPRVIQPESDEMVNNIKEAGGIVEYVLFPDEGHGFRKTKNRIEGYNKVLKFLDKYLKGVDQEPATEEPAEEPEATE